MLSRTTVALLSSSRCFRVPWLFSLLPSFRHFACRFAYTRSSPCAAFSHRYTQPATPTTCDTPRLHSRASETRARTPRGRCAPPLPAPSAVSMVTSHVLLHCSKPPLVLAFCTVSSSLPLVEHLVAPDRRWHVPTTLTDTSVQHTATISPRHASPSHSHYPLAAVYQPATNNKRPNTVPLLHAGAHRSHTSLGIQTKAPPATHIIITPARAGLVVGHWNARVPARDASACVITAHPHTLCLFLQ